MEPPLIEGVVDKRRHRSVIVWEGLERDVESPHSRREYRYKYDARGEGSSSPRSIVYDVPMCAFTGAVSKSHRGMVVIIRLISCFVGMRS